MYDKLKLILKDRGIAVNKLSFMAMISPSDLYSALKGNKPMFPAWRKRISEALMLPEDELFCEIKISEEEETRNEINTRSDQLD